MVRPGDMSTTLPATVMGGLGAFWLPPVENELMIFFCFMAKDNIMVVSVTNAEFGACEASLA